MIGADWKSLLEKHGDVIEQRGVKKCGLNASFPNYAEFWGRYILANRDRENPSKLRRDVKPEFEDIFNSHYSVFYQLTVALVQLRNLQSPLLDVSTPLYHLGTTVDLVERTCLALLHAKDAINLDRLDEPDYRRRTSEFWENEYQGRFKKFEKNYRPVALNFHSVTDTVSGAIPDWKTYNRSFQKVREYRNVFTHSLSPLKLIIDGQTYVPKPPHLQKYTDARWSSGQNRVDKNDYALATDVITTLAQDLIENTNNLWTVLLGLMEALMRNKFPGYEGEIMGLVSYLTPYEESGGIWVSYDGPLNKPYTYSGEREN